MPGFELFGWIFKRKDPTPTQQTTQFAPEIKNDGALVTAAGGAYGTFVDMEGTIRTDVELITKYRDMALQPEIDLAIDHIVNDAIVQEENQPILSINLDKVDNLPENIKNLLTEEFQNALNLLQFNVHSYDIFRAYYVDGRLYYNVVIDTTDPTAGIQKLIFIDPRKLKKVREVVRKKVGQPNDNTSPLVVEKNEYFLYNEKGFASSKNISAYGGSNPTQGFKIASDTIVHVTSGLTDGSGRVVLSYIHKAIKTLNALRSLEDSTVIYRITRAPERRVFYIDVGTLPKVKAEQYLRDMMTVHKNKLVYDGTTGEVRDDRKFMTMTEDFWIPRREGSKGTEISTLPAGQNLGKMEDVEYFQKKLFRALHVPFDRLQEDSSAFGDDSSTMGITREELKFARFIDRLRLKFSDLFTQIIGKNAVLKGILTLDEWNEISHKITYDYAADNYICELKEKEILMGRVQLEQMVEPLIGRFYSNEFVRKHVLHQTDQQITENDKQIQQEQNNPQFLTVDQKNMIQQQALDQESK